MDPSIPVSVIVQSILPFIADRITYNSVKDCCREARDLVRQGYQDPPWPEIIVKTTHVVSSVGFSPDGTSLAYASRQQSGIIALDRASGVSRILEAPRPGGVVTSICFSMDGKFLASSGKEGEVLVHNLTTCEVNEIRGFGRVFCLAFSPDSSNLLIGCENGAISSWSDLETLGSVQLLQPGRYGHGSIRSISFVSDDFVTADADQQIQYWSASKGYHTVISNSSGSSPCCAVSKDENYIAHSRCNSTASLRKLPLDDPRNTPIILSGHSSTVSCLQFSPDSKFLATGSFDRNIHLWDVETGKCVGTFRGHSQPIVVLSFSPDGRFLASGSHDCSLRVWNLTQKSCVKQ